MKITILSLENPIYSKADNSTIDVMLTTGEHGIVPFTAAPFDSEQYGRDIYADLVAGKYGSISPYTPK